MHWYELHPGRFGAEVGRQEATMVLLPLGRQEGRQGVPFSARANKENVDFRDHAEAHVKKQAGQDGHSRAHMVDAAGLELCCADLCCTDLCCADMSQSVQFLAYDLCAVCCVLSR